MNINNFVMGSNLKFRADKKKISIEYGDESLGTYSTIDVRQEFQKLGGTISPHAEVEFHPYFPGSGYGQTALTNQMPPSYLCMGSMSLTVFENSRYQGGIAVSVYKDTSGHDPKLGDHYNLFLQWDVRSNKNHTPKIPNRHIPITNKVKIIGLLEDREIESVSIIEYPHP